MADAPHLYAPRMTVAASLHVPDPADHAVPKGTIIHVPARRCRVRAQPVLIRLPVAFRRSTR